jgi:hypothetical protein
MPIHRRFSSETLVSTPLIAFEGFQPLTADLRADAIGATLGVFGIASRR